MAQTHSQQLNPPSFSPPVSTPSPSAASPANANANAGAIPPPQKRQRLSPLPQSQSPYASPSFGTLQLPANASPNMNGMSANSVPATPAPGPAPPGSMGPPSRPVEKTTDASELTDVLASSGIDVREEEAFLTNSYSQPSVQVQQSQRSDLPPLNTSFTSQTSTPGTPSANASFELSQPKPYSTQESSFPSAPSSQPNVFRDPNEATREDTQAARRSQYHLQDPFLYTKVLEQRLQKRGFELGVRIPSEGLFHPVPGRPQPIEVTGPDGSSTIRTGQTILNQEGAPLVDILTLLSLCCEERLRNVLDYSSTLAKSRRLHSHGIIPPEWQDVANPADPAQAAASSPSSGSLKRAHIDGQTPTNKIAEQYRLLVEKDVASEEARAAKRAKRNANAILGDGAVNKAAIAEITSSGPATPVGTPGGPLTGLDKKTISKKEAKRQMDARASEAQQHQQSIETARMATSSFLSGSRFGNKKNYSWLNKGGASGSGYSTPRAGISSTSGGGVDKTAKPGDAKTTITTKKFGDWREDQEKGAGIQLRDILYTLEQDGRAMKHIQRAYSKDSKEDRVE